MTSTLPGSALLRLPARANPEHLKKQAKQLLHAWRADEPEARQAVSAFHPRPNSFAGLRDAQLVLARRYGFNDWQALCNEVELRQLQSGSLAEQAKQFVMLGCLHYNGDDREWRHARAAALLQQQPAIGRANLYSALVAGNLDAVTVFLERSPDLATQTGGPNNWPALLYLTYSRVPAEKAKVMGILHLLLKHGADPDAHVILGEHYRFTALTGAMGEGEQGPVNCPAHSCADELVTTLLAAGASANEGQGLYNTMFTRSIDRWLPLLFAHGLNNTHRLNWQSNDPQRTCDYFLAQAVAHGSIERVQLLLDHGANPDAVNGYNQRSSHTNAILGGHAEIAACLVAHGAKIEKLGPDDEFRLACRHNDRPRALMLIKEHPELTQNVQLFRDTAARDLDHAVWLIGLGFDVNGQTGDGRTMLHQYAWSNRLDAVQKLVQLGANPDLKEHVYGATPLGFALHNRARSVIAFLQDTSNDIFDVCRMAHAERAVTLLAKEPSLVDQRTPMGNTPLHLVSQANEEDPDLHASAAVIDLLLTNGADIDAVNNEGLTPAQWYRRQGMDDLADLVERYDRARS